MFPTPDPSWSPTPFEAWAVAAGSASFELVQLGLFAGVVAFAVVLFTVGVLMVSASVRR